MFEDRAASGWSRARLWPGQRGRIRSPAHLPASAGCGGQCSQKGHEAQGEGGQDQVVEPLPEGYLAVEDANGGGKAQGETSPAPRRTPAGTPVPARRWGRCYEQSFSKSGPEAGPGSCPWRSQTKAYEAGKQPGAEHQRQRELTNRSPMMSKTGRRYRRDCPKSPRTRAFQLGDVSLHRRGVHPQYSSSCCRSRRNAPGAQYILLHRVHGGQAHKGKGNDADCQQQQKRFAAIPQKIRPKRPTIPVIIHFLCNQ